MNRDKQIDEMAKDIEQARIKATDTTNSMNYGFGGWYAKELYNAGYRKASKVAREIFEEIEKILTSLDNRHMLCGNPKQAWGVRSVASEIEKLKEKYAPDTNVGCNTEGKR